MVFFMANLFSQNLSIAGIIKNTVDRPICKARVDLFSNGNFIKHTVSNEKGYYKFDSLINGRNYEIEVSKEGDFLNGMSTFDLAIITRSLLGLENLSNPILLYSADLNASSSVTTFDLALYQKFIIGADSSFTAPNWHFFNEDIDLTASVNTWDTKNIKARIYENLTTSITDANFVGNKTGDMNNSANPCGN